MPTKKELEEQIKTLQEELFLANNGGEETEERTSQDEIAVVEETVDTGQKKLNSVVKPIRVDSANMAVYAVGVSVIDLMKSTGQL